MMAQYTISIDTERCTGCGTCLDACPTGAIYLVGGKAAIDNSLCNACQACLVACPSGVITCSDAEDLAQAAPLPASALPVPSSERREPASQTPVADVLPPTAVQPRGAASEVIQVRVPPTVPSERTRGSSLFGAALTWAGHEVVPRLADWILDALDRPNRRTSASLTEPPSRGGQAGGRKGAGRQRRYRRRGGA